MKSRAMIDQILTMKKSGCPIRKIAAALHISRNTVRAYLRSQEAKDVATPDDIKKETGDWQQHLDWETLINERRKGVTAQQLYKENAIPISYSRFCRYLKARISQPVKPATRLDHQPAERTQVDFADGINIIDPKSGKARKTHLFCGVLPFSSYTFGEFVFDQKLPTFIRCHEKMFAYFGGVTPYVILDNLKSGVKNAHRYDPELNPTYCDFGNKVGFAALPARPYTPRDKACVEAMIGVIQRGFYQLVRNEKFYCLADLNQKFRAYLSALNTMVMKDYGISRAERFLTEAPLLLSLPGEAYELVEWKTAKVHPDCCIQVFKALYSVPFKHCGKSLRIKATDKVIEVYDEDLELIAHHLRQPIHGQSIVEDHLPPTRMQETQFDIRRSIALAENVGVKTHELVTQLLSGDRPLRFLRRVQGILRLLNKGISKESLEYGCRTALTFNRLQLSYVKSCSEHYQNTGGKLRLTAGTPVRKPETIHLHGG